MKKGPFLNKNSRLNDSDNQQNSSTKKISRKRCDSSGSQRGRDNAITQRTQLFNNIFKNQGKSNEESKMYRYIRSKQINNLVYQTTLSNKLLGSNIPIQICKKNQQPNDEFDSSQKNSGSKNVSKQLRTKRYTEVSFQNDKTSAKTNSNDNLKKFFDLNKTANQKLNSNIMESSKQNCSHQIDSLSKKIKILEQQNAKLKRQICVIKSEKKMYEQNEERSQNYIQQIEQRMNNLKRQLVNLLSSIRNKYNQIELQIQRNFGEQQKVRGRWVELNRNFTIEDQINIGAFTRMYLQPASDIINENIRRLTQKIYCFQAQIEKLEIKQSVKMKQEYQVSNRKEQVKSLAYRLSVQKNKTSKYQKMYEQVKSQLSQIRKIGSQNFMKVDKKQYNWSKRKRNFSHQQQSLSFVLSQQQKQQRLCQSDREVKLQSQRKLSFKKNYYR